MDNINFDEGGGDYQTSLYNYTGLATGVNSFADIDAAQLEAFHQQGYLVVHNAFSMEEISAALEGLVNLIAGKVEGFQNIHFEAKAKAILATLSLEHKQDAVRKLIEFVEYDPALKHLSQHPALLDTVTRLMANPPVMFQDMALIKPPLIGREKPWHQDNAFFNIPVDTTIVGVWIALDEATIENGCMHIKPGSHRQGPVRHSQQRDWQICDDKISSLETVAVPLKPGGCLLFHGLMQHGTPASQSLQRRRAVQFHYKPANAPELTPEQHRNFFGHKDHNVTC